MFPLESVRSCESTEGHRLPEAEAVADEEVVVELDDPATEEVADPLWVELRDDEDWEEATTPEIRLFPPAAVMLPLLFLR
jgi:hypothetical protein